MSEKLNINNEMREFNRKNRGFWDELNEDERKKFSTYLIMRWGSAIQSAPAMTEELQKYCVLAMNENVNPYMFNLSKHPKLQWLLLSTVSPGSAVYSSERSFPKHEWIAFKGQRKASKRTRLLQDMYPDQKLDECELLSELIPDAELKQMLLDRGYPDKDIKEALK